jgi:hypothetical protein
LEAELLLGLYRGIFEIGVTKTLGKASRAFGHAVMRPLVAAVLFFVRVNQVLVRLWARAIEVVRSVCQSVNLRVDGCRSMTSPDPVVRSYV